MHLTWKEFAFWVFAGLVIFAVLVFTVIGIESLRDDPIAQEPNPNEVKVHLHNGMTVTVGYKLLGGEETEYTRQRMRNIVEDVTWEKWGADEAVKFPAQEKSVDVK